MMKIDFKELESERYWSFPQHYTGNKQRETKYMITSGLYMGAEKKDGAYMRFVKDDDGNMTWQGRTRGVDGNFLDKIELVPQLQDFFSGLPNGTCLLGEAYLPEKRGSRNVTTILGCLKDKAIARQNTNEDDKIHYYVFDVWAYNRGEGLSKTIEERVAILNQIRQQTNNDYVEFANYLEGEPLWEELGRILNSGGEGIVITKKGSKPEPGKRTARKTLKVKMEIENTIDAFLTGKYKPATVYYNSDKEEDWLYWQNDKTGEKYNQNMYDEYSKGAPINPITKAHYYGWASSVEFGVYKDNKIVPIGWISGISDELKAGIVENNEKYKGKVAELTAMEIQKIDGHYSLRHGRIKQFRDDKKAEDCEFSQIEQ